MIGIDALDSILLSKFESELPNLRELMKNAPKIHMQSVFPPDSPVAWASIYTGKSPASTGIVYFRSPLDNKSFVTALDDSENSIRGRLQGTCFWDYLSQHQKKVCVLFPLAVYPPWPVNGVMVSRSMRHLGANCAPAAYPSQIGKDKDLSGLNMIQEISSLKASALYKIIAKCKNLLSNEFSFGIEMLRKDDWDLFFMYSSVLDSIQHCFWSHHDDKDPTHVAGTPFKDVIKDFYVLYDKKIGELLSAVNSGSTVIIFSDHGHGMRPVNLVNINEILRKEGYLVSKGGQNHQSNLSRFTEMAKRAADRLISVHGVEVIAARLLRLFPWARKIYAAPSGVDWDKTIACVSDLSGIKAYSYGGIEISGDAKKRNSYEELRSAIIDRLSIIREPTSGINIMKWICRREELYQGEFINRYPDIVFELQEGYGIGWSIHCPIMGKSGTHEIHPGSHRSDSPVFLISYPGSENFSQFNITLMDIAPTVLDLLNVHGDFLFDGKSIFNPEH
jgi:predicted AlkP superfamily phosphohydrolase/phosphomutase